jgi:folate-dependent phosphoribosylglycinamide formyltransferase PurN
MRKLKIAVLTDYAHVPRFALSAIDEITDCTELTVFSCTNTRIKRRPIKHGAYYALNLLSIRNTLTTTVSIELSRKHVVRTITFASGWEGNWQTLPEDVLQEIRQSRFDVIIKVGMYLLKVPPQAELPVPILSFHHGDPDHYRGRPAGFWETLYRERTMGQIVQVISNELDAGPVVAFAETKVYPYPLQW